MTKPEEVLTIAEQYRAQLTEAQDKEAIREKQAWYREQAAPLFKQPPASTSTNK